jgi:hypothetical protein
MFTDVWTVSIDINFPQKMEQYVRIPTYQTARCHDPQVYSTSLTATEASNSGVFAQSKNTMTTFETVEFYLHTSSISALVGGVSHQFHARPATSPWTAGMVRLKLGLDAWRGRKIASMLGIEQRSLLQNTQQECPQQHSLPVTRRSNAAAHKFYKMKKIPRGHLKIPGASWVTYSKVISEGPLI